ncbi:hypothetical protein Q3O60_00395 [Alkalimonas collagenimarina]|uniref:Uncharacterized protein n=1 Tax=Alkalimonas collagenimarina TaxID=400390 RepID=A0ABT9GVC2_9GAMM|nr:hypothetical protein [Alkalimonas collagenimarina]MDP4534655.1 hypothetical protein [Alkalimonas collagenimarina]
MDVIIPFLQRTPGTPVEQEPRVVPPVFKEARLTPLKKEKEQREASQQYRSKYRRRKDDLPAAPDTTPEDQQTIDEDGHVDIYI